MGCRVRLSGLYRRDIIAFVAKRLFPIEVRILEA